MKKASAVRIVKRLNDNCIESRVYENYSGRGMFGATTFGVAIDAQYKRNSALVVSPALKKYNSDSLGMGVIFY